MFFFEYLLSARCEQGALPGLSRRFPARGELAPPGTFGNIWRHFFQYCHHCGAGVGAATGIQWAEARGDAEHAKMHGPQTATASESAAPTPADAGSVRSEVRPRRGSGGETGSDAP